MIYLINYKDENHNEECVPSLFEVQIKQKIFKPYQETY